MATWAPPHLHDSQMDMCVGVPKVTVGPHIHTSAHPLAYSRLTGPCKDRGLC